MGQVRIGRDFFANARKDYRDANWAWVREIMQNSIDAPKCDRIDITVLALPDGDTEVTVRNNGKPMDEATLVGKLLTLGESGKRFQNDEEGVAKTGGFGKAKELLYFCQLGYAINTGDISLVGVGGDYEIAPSYDTLNGTTSIVTMEGDVTDRITGAFKRFCQLSQWPGIVTLNGETLPTNLKKGSHRRDFHWAKVYSNRQHERLMVVRINGTPMFSRPIDFKGCIIVELTGNSGERLSANRDSLLWEIGHELDEFVTQLAVDKKSALRQRQAEIKRYEGERLKNEAKKPKAVGTIAELFSSEDEGTPHALAAFIRGVEAAPQAGITETVTSREEVRVSIGPEFYLKNTTGMVVPDYYCPDKAFSDYSRKLALAWGACLLEIHKILEISCDFSIGFILDEESRAEYESGAEGTVYYINPATLVSQRDKPQCRSFRAAYTGAWANRFEIISVAAHEIVHGMGYDRHDENYSSEYTRVMGIVLQHLGKLTPLFRS